MLLGRNSKAAGSQCRLVGARRTALCRHGSDIKDALLDAGCENLLPSSLALPLQSVGLLDELLRTKIVAERRFKL
eukprot:4418802-Pleurochrysis_carterae.AAC.1